MSEKKVAPEAQGVVTVEHLHSMEERLLASMEERFDKRDREVDRKLAERFDKQDRNFEEKFNELGERVAKLDADLSRHVKRLDDDREQRQRQHVQLQRELRGLAEHLTRSVQRQGERISTLESHATYNQYAPPASSPLHPVDFAPDGGGLHAPRQRWRRLIIGRD